MMTSKAGRRRGWLASLGIMLTLPIASCGNDHPKAGCAWSPTERDVASAELDSWRGDLSEIARAAMSNPELELYNSFTESDGSAPLHSDPCLLRQVQLTGMSLRVTELSGPQNVRSYIDNDSIAASNKYSQLLPSADADPSPFATDAEATWYCNGEVTSCPMFSVAVQVRSCAGLVVEGTYYENNDTNEQSARDHLTAAITETLDWAQDHFNCSTATYPLPVFDPLQ